MTYKEAIILFETKQYSKAKKALKLLLKSGKYSKNKAAIYNYLSRISLEEGDFPKAIEYANRILKNDKKNYYAYQLLGKINYKSGKYEDALYFLYNGSVLDLNDQSGIHYDLAELYIFFKKYHKAISELTIHISRNKSPNPRSYFMLAKLYFDFEDYDNTLKYIALGNAKGYNDKYSYYMAGKIYLSKNDLKRAQAYMILYLEDKHMGNALIEEEIKYILSLDRQPCLS